MRFHPVQLPEGWATAPRLVWDLENDNAEPLDCAPSNHAWPDELMPETTCDRCGLRYCDWSEIDS